MEYEALVFAVAEPETAQIWVPGTFAALAVVEHKLADLTRGKAGEGAVVHAFAEQTQNCGANENGSHRWEPLVFW